MIYDNHNIITIVINFTAHRVVKKKNGKNIKKFNVIGGCKYIAHSLLYNMQMNRNARYITNI